MKHHSARLRVGVLLLTAFTLLASVKTFWKNYLLSRESIGSDAVTLHEKRFAKLARALPSNEFITIGYVSDPEITSANIPAIKQYVLTQYALAPAIIDEKWGHRFVVGNFTSANYRLPVHEGWTVQDFGDGVFLFIREGR